MSSTRTMTTFGVRALSLGSAAAAGAAPRVRAQAAKARREGRMVHPPRSGWWKSDLDLYTEAGGAGKIRVGHSLSGPSGAARPVTRDGRGFISFMSRTPTDETQKALDASKSGFAH